MVLGTAALVMGNLASGAASANNWMAQIGGLGAEVVFDLTETSDGRLCATGTFSNDTLFGAADHQVTLHADTIQDIYVACYANDGKLETAVQFGADISDQPRAIAALPDGDILITGYFLNRFGAGKSGTLVAEGGADIFLTRLDRNGEEVWSRKFGGSFADNGNALAVTADGDILLAGNFQDAITYKSGDEIHEITSAGSRDAFVFRLNDDGEILWAESFGGKGRDEASRVVAADDGSIIIAGTFEDTAMVGRSTGKMTSRGGTDAFLIAFSAEGQLAWSRQIGSANREYVSGLVTDGQGNLFLSGNFLDTLILPDGSDLRSAGSTDAFLLRFGSDGEQHWARRIGGDEIDESFDLAITEGRELLMSGHFQGDIEIPVANAKVLLRSSGKGNPDGFIMTFDTNGNHGQAITAAGDGVETLFAVAALRGGGIAAAGFFNKEVSIVADGLVKLTKRGKTDVFLARMKRELTRSGTGAAARLDGELQQVRLP